MSVKNLLGCLLVLFLIPSIGLAKSESEIRQALESIMVQRVSQAPAKWWQDLGTAAPKTIMTVYGETKGSFRRIRLIEGLAFFSDAETLKFLKAQAAQTTNNVIRQKAIQSIGRNAQAFQQKDFLASYLTHRDPQTRLQAALALKHMGDSDSAEKVNTFLANEKTDWVVKQLNADSDKTAASNSHSQLVKRKTPYKD